MRVLVVAGEAPTNRQHVTTVLDALNEAGDDALLVIGASMPGPYAYEARTKLGRTINGFLWARLAGRETATAPAPALEGPAGDELDLSNAAWTTPFPPSRGRLPWRPDVIIVVTPNQGGPSTRSYLGAA